MAINTNESKKIAIFGAVAGVATTWLLNFAVMPILNFLAGVVPAVSAKLADGGAGTISISVRESLTGLNGGLAGWLSDALGLSVSIPGTAAFMPYVLGAIGGALLFVVGAYAADATGMLKGTSVSKTRSVIFWGNAAAALIIGGFAAPQIGLSLVDAIIAFAINAAILAYVYVTLDDKLGIGLVPF